MNTIERLRELLEKATPGPWVTCNGTDIFTDTDDAKRGLPGNHVADCDPARDKEHIAAISDACIIVSIRNALPALLEVADAAQKYKRAGWLSLPGSIDHEESRAIVDALARLDEVTP